MGSRGWGGQTNPNPERDGPVSGLAWHPRLPILATASGTSVRLWSTENWKMLEEIRLKSAHEAPLLDIPGEEGRRLFVWIGGNISIFEPKCFQKTP
jgi:WD40 repeat protein